MNKKLLISGILVSLLIFSFGLVGCDNGSTSGGGEGPNTFGITAISPTQYAQGWDKQLIGLFPTETVRSEALSDADAVIASSGTTYIVAGIVDPPFASSAGNYSASGSLLSKSSGFTSNWRGDGTYHIWFALKSSGTWTTYRTINPVILTAGGNWSGSAQTDFEKKTSD
jgi:hypothetical protein